MCTPRCSGSRSTEQEISAKTSFSCGPRRRRIALLTPRTPARERPMRTSGCEAWRSERRSVRSIYAPKRTRGAIVLQRRTTSLLQARQPCVPRPAHAARDRVRVRAHDHAGGRARPDARRLLGDDRDRLAAARRAARRALARRADRGRPLRAEARPGLDAASSPRRPRERLGDERVGVSGDGADGARSDGERGEALGLGARPVRAPPRRPRRASRSSPTAPELRVSPITPASAPVVLGEDLRDLGAAVAVRHVGGSAARSRSTARR